MHSIKEQVSVTSVTKNLPIKILIVNDDNDELHVFSSNKLMISFA